MRRRRGVAVLVIAAVGACSSYGTDDPAATPDVDAGATGDADVPCDGADLTTSARHCGTCGHVCGSVNGIGQCQAGTCVFVCNSGFARCGDDASGCDTEIASNPGACGACGHSCLGGTCNAGKCAPVSLVKGVPTPRALAVDATDVFWTDNVNGNVWSCPVGGCDAQGPVDVAKIATVAEIDVDAQNVYVSTAGTSGAAIRRCVRPQCGGGSVQIALAPQNTVSGPPYLFQEGADVFFTSALNGRLYSVAKDAPENNSPRVEVGSTDYPRMIAKAPGVAYMIAGSGGTADAAVLRCALSGCAAGATVVFESPVGGLTRLAGAPEGVYWLTLTGAIQACDAESCTDGSARTLVSSQDRPADLVVVGDTVFWTNRGAPGSATGAVRSCKTASCASSLQDLATGLAEPTRLAVTSTAVFWIEEGSGSVVRAAR